MSEIKIKLKNADIEAFIQIEKYPFPKYTSSVINLINGFAQGTRPKVVGQMSELIKEFNGHNLEEWISWYNEKEPNSI